MNLSSGKSDRYGSSELQENLDYLRQTYFFETLPIHSLKVIAYICRREFFKKGDLVFQQNEDDGQAIYIISGRAVLEREAENRSIEIREHEAGDFLGGLALLGPMPRLFSLKAMMDTTCLIMTREKFAKVIAQFPESMDRILSALLNGIYIWEKQRLTDHAGTCQDCMKRAGVSLV